jgi:alpha-L-fucosidase
LNVGPKADGTFPQESIDRLKEVGTWMKVNGESIYNTKASPFGLFTWGRCTIKENKGNTTVYISVFNWPADGKLLIPGLKNQVTAAKLLANGSTVKTTASADGLVIDVPAKAPDAIASVIKLEVKGVVASGTATAKTK